MSGKFKPVEIQFYRESIAKHSSRNKHFNRIGGNFASPISAFSISARRNCEITDFRYVLLSFKNKDLFRIRDNSYANLIQINIIYFEQN